MKIVQLPAPVRLFHTDVAAFRGEGTTAVDIVYVEHAVGARALRANDSSLGNVLTITVLKTRQSWIAVFAPARNSQ